MKKLFQANSLPKPVCCWQLWKDSKHHPANSLKSQLVCRWQLWKDCKHLPGKTVYLSLFVVDRREKTLNIFQTKSLPKPVCRWPLWKDSIYLPDKQFTSACLSLTGGVSLAPPDRLRMALMRYQPRVCDKSWAIIAAAILASSSSDTSDRRPIFYSTREEPSVEDEFSNSGKEWQSWHARELM